MNDRKEKKRGDSLGRGRKTADERTHLHVEEKGKRGISAKRIPLSRRKAKRGKK